jgi:MFS family permease
MLQTLRSRGEIITSLDPSRHISMLALSNTISRLASGLISDYMASPNRARPASRIPFLLFLSLTHVVALFLLAYSPIALLRNWFLIGSILVGIGYGGIFTLAPTVVSVVWGIDRFGRNWGFLTFTPGPYSLHFPSAVVQWGLIFFSTWSYYFWSAICENV